MHWWSHSLCTRLFRNLKYIRQKSSSVTTESLHDVCWSLVLLVLCTDNAGDICYSVESLYFLCSFPLTQLVSRILLPLQFKQVWISAKACQLFAHKSLCHCSELMSHSGWLLGDAIEGRSPLHCTILYTAGSTCTGFAFSSA